MFINYFLLTSQIRPVDLMAAVIGCSQKNHQASVAVPPATVRVSSQMPLTLSVMSVS